MDRKSRIDELMDEMPEEWRLRWCNSQACACMGGANCSGGLMKMGFTKAEWIDWLKRNGLEPAKGLSLEGIKSFIKQEEAQREVARLIAKHQPKPVKRLETRKIITRQYEEHHDR